MGEDVGALDPLRGEAKDVVDYQDGACGGGGASRVCVVEYGLLDRRGTGRVRSV